MEEDDQTSAVPLEPLEDEPVMKPTEVENLKKRKHEMSEAQLNQRAGARASKKLKKQKTDELIKELEEKKDKAESLATELQSQLSIQLSELEAMRKANDRLQKEVEWREKMQKAEAQPALPAIQPPPVQEKIIYADNPKPKSTILRW